MKMKKYKKSKKTHYLLECIDKRAEFLEIKKIII